MALHLIGTIAWHSPAHAKLGGVHDACRWLVVSYHEPFYTTQTPGSLAVYFQVRFVSGDESKLDCKCELAKSRSRTSNNPNPDPKPNPEM